MNKKGFTLVELLAVIVVLGLISLLTVPTVGKIIRDNREKTANVNIDTILNAAYDFVQRNPSYLPNNIDGTTGTKILLNDLITAGLIKEDMVNPKTDSKYNKNCEIIITYYSVAPANVPEHSKFFGNYLFQFIEK